MNKHTFMARAVAAVAAVAFALGTGGLLTSGAMADDAAPASGDITISLPTDTTGEGLVAQSMEGRSFTAYKLADYADVQASGDNVTSYNLVADGSVKSELLGWIKSAVAPDGTVPSNFSKVVSLNSDTLTFIGEAENLTPIQFVAKYFYGSGIDAYGNDHADNEQMRLFAHAAEASLKDTKGITATVNGNTATFDTAGSQGLYLIVETTSEEPKGELISRAMVIGTPMTVDGKTYTNVVSDNGTYSLGNIQLKAERVNVTKDVKQGTDQLIQIGSTREFTITANVPDYATEFPDSTGLTFSLGDTASSNLTPFDGDGNVNNLSVTAKSANDDKATTLTEGTDYTVSTNPAANSFTVSLTDSAAQSGKTIAATYTGTVTSLSEDKTTNTATVDFSDNPYDHTSHNTTTTTKNLYATKLVLDKVKFNDSNTKLNGARFTVMNENSQQPVKFDKSADGMTYTVDPKGTETAITAIHDKNGNGVTIKGLGADSAEATTYTFTETKAPEGYLLGENPVTFTMLIDLQTDDENGLTQVAFLQDSENHKNFIDLSTINTDIQSVNNTDANAKTTFVDGGTMRVENTTSASDFAKTGGDIMTVLGIVVALAVIGAVCLIVARTRRQQV